MSESSRHARVANRVDRDTATDTSDAPPGASRVSRDPRLCSLATRSRRSMPSRVPRKRAAAVTPRARLTRLDPRTSRPPLKTCRRRPRLASHGRRHLADAKHAGEGTPRPTRRPRRFPRECSARRTRKKHGKHQTTRVPFAPPAPRNASILGCRSVRSRPDARTRRREP